ncbi:hypothetical protein F5Y15DRAFT_431198 [Xylariaceae sp. FL0016]|nr:hypothetical protein F5Y15DRAFT_431198 [Xylariaceae sp. FL0016]
MASDTDIQHIYNRLSFELRLVVDNFRREIQTSQSSNVETSQNDNIEIDQGDYVDDAAIQRIYDGLPLELQLVVDHFCHESQFSQANDIQSSQSEDSEAVWGKILRIGRTLDGKIGVINPETPRLVQYDVLLFGADSFEDSEVADFEPLDEHWLVKDVAVDWRALTSRSKIENVLKRLVAFLRRIDFFVVAACHDGCEVLGQCDAQHPIRMRQAPLSTILRYDSRDCNWSTVARRVLFVLRDGGFWSEVNAEYQLNRVPRLSTPPHIPAFFCYEFYRGCSHEGDLVVPEQSFRSRERLYPGDGLFEDLEDPEQDTDAFAEWQWNEYQ